MTINLLGLQPHPLDSKEASAMATKPLHILQTLIGMMRGHSFLLWTWNSQASSSLPAALRREHTHLGKVCPSPASPVEETEPAHCLRPLFCLSSLVVNPDWCYLKSTITKTPLLFLLFHVILTSLGFWDRLWGEYCPWISAIIVFFYVLLFFPPLEGKFLKNWNLGGWCFYPKEKLQKFSSDFLFRFDLFSEWGRKQDHQLNEGSGERV